MYTKLRKMRNQKGYSTKDMSDMLEISKPFYCQLENGTRRLTYSMAVKIAGIFQKKPDQIFYNDEKEN